MYNTLYMYSHVYHMYKNDTQEYCLVTDAGFLRGGENVVANTTKRKIKTVITCWRKTSCCYLTVQWTP